MSQRASKKKQKVKWVRPTAAEEAAQAAKLYAERYENPFTAANRNIKVGDRVRQAGWFAEYNRKNNLPNPEGTVTDISPHDPNNPIESHGGIEVLFDDGVERSFADYFKEDPLEKI